MGIEVGVIHLYPTQNQDQRKKRMMNFKILSKSGTEVSEDQYQIHPDLQDLFKKISKSLPSLLNQTTKVSVLWRPLNLPL